MPNTTIRHTVKKARNALSKAQQQRAAMQLALRVGRHPAFRKSHTLSLYLASKGEINLQPLIRLAIKQGKRCYLPVLHGPKLKFLEYKKTTKLIKNRFGLQEPSLSEEIRASQLDLILCPLVAFDNKGNRLGMGGGYYDRTLGQLKKRRKKVIWGVAHELQRQAGIVTYWWDIKLDGIFTDKRVTTPH
ncbi:5-formyltetrahydrofolate cyclo-ligase [Marinagarivorans cellulosilyticus]|uniref:5-formyltetrahydrofolate cyclo-ligase n=1 Tax=Marinagarivorans cellulosilyticus TaxID=2721545 RepID=A0AAN1WI33_9GAMM|nr:5-formyltetrahydrofolate cyclo-ligase [Marinagarivorans cellulosilyticus]BCD97940.1 5-formyltetrahydrofolate cyclo-ligase [Marinagarivorans cellulosilyticus]